MRMVSTNRVLLTGARFHGGVASCTDRSDMDLALRMLEREHVRWYGGNGVVLVRDMREVRDLHIVQ